MVHQVLPQQVFTEGQKIDGVVVEVKDQMATIMSHGKTFTAQMMNSALSEGQHVMIEITSVTPDAVFAENIVTKEEGLLSKLEMPVSRENIDVLLAMEKEGIPVSQRAVQTIQQTTRTVRAFVELLQSESSQVSDRLFIDQLPSMLDQPLKSTVIDFMASQRQQPSISHSTETLQEAFVKEAMIGKDLAESIRVPQNQRADGYISVAQNLTKPMPETASVIHHKEAISSAKLIIMEWLTASQTSITMEQKQALQTLIQTYDARTGALFLKHDIPLTLRNLLLSAYDLKDLADVIQKAQYQVKSPTLTPMLPQLLQAVIKSKSGEELLEQLLNQTETEAVEWKQTLLAIKEQMSIPKSSEQQFFYMPCTIPMQDKEQTMDLYFKKKSANKNGDSLDILIALHTHEIGDVRCMIRYELKSIHLQFGVENIGIVDSFRAQCYLLEERLAERTDKPVYITIDTADEQWADEFFKGESGSTGFDMRV